MTRLAVLTTATELIEHLKSEHDRQTVMLQPEQLTQPAHVLASVNADALLLDTMSLGVSLCLDLIEELQRTSAVPTLLLAADPANIALPALRAGARDVLNVSSTSETIWEATERAVAAQLYANSAEVEIRQKGRVIAVLSPKGGVGKTTLSSNLAVALALHLPGQVVLVDGDVQFGDVASALDLEPEYSIVDAVSPPAQQDSMVLKSYLAQHRTGLFAVCGPDDPAQADDATPDAMSRLLEQLSNEFRFVVVDTAPGLDDRTLTCIDAATDLVVMSALDVPGVRGLRKELAVLNELKPESTLRVAVNMVDREGGLTIGDVQASIKQPVDISLPNDPNVRRSVNAGVPLVEEDHNSAFVKQVERLVDILAPGLPPRPRAKQIRKGKDKPDASIPQRGIVLRPWQRAKEI